jgi:hypothetical protein
MGHWSNISTILALDTRYRWGVSFTPLGLVCTGHETERDPESRRRDKSLVPTGKRTSTPLSSNPYAERYKDWATPDRCEMGRKNILKWKVASIPRILSAPDFIVRGLVLHFKVSVSAPFSNYVLNNTSVYSDQSWHIHYSIEQILNTSRDFLQILNAMTASVV